MMTNSMMTVAVANQITWSEHIGRYLVRGDVSWHEMTLEEWHVISDMSAEQGFGCVAQMTTFANRSGGLRDLIGQ